MKRIAIIGSTGSVGRNVLKVVDHLPDQFQVVGLAARSSVEELAAQTARYRPGMVAVADPARVKDFAEACRRRGAKVPEILSGEAGLSALAGAPDIDLVVAAAVGSAGLEPTHAALQAGRRVALANKEAMVVAGELLRKTAAAAGGVILPVDSEHNAIDQCLRSGRGEEIRRLILTASGGPFRDMPAEVLEDVTPEQALAHPTWKMGPRITIDSATLMNKGFEVIEARWLFDVPESSIEVLIHPQSVVHSMVEFIDGSVMAQMGPADMRGPIQYALTYPERLGAAFEPLDWTTIPALDFRVPDRARFPSIGLAYRAIEMGGTAPAVLNAADEVAVGAFLDRRISFGDLPRIVEAVLDLHAPAPADSIPSILAADRWAREAALRHVTMRSA